MKPNRTYLFIAITSIALLIVLIIQVNWILQTAKIREELFNEKANMVLSRTADALASDKQTCRNLEMCVGKNEVDKIDSMFKHYMNFYNIHINYFFEVKSGVTASKNGIGSANNNYPADQDYFKNSFKNAVNADQTGSYRKKLEEAVSKNGLELRLVFPQKEEFIMAEMGTIFITSVLLILVVFILYWRTILSLIKEKKISEHTTDFLNNMTHEFKTPLTNIALAGKMMLKNSNIKLEDKIKHYSGIILEENEKLRHQVEHVLSMTALERGEIPLQKTELDFHQLIDDAVKCMSVQIENAQGILKLDLNAHTIVVMGDKVHLTNTLCNLIDNAIKYSTSPPELSIQTFNKDQHLIVRVSDKGIGIEKGYQKKVFDKFFRVSTGDVHDVKGFGLGLAYIKKIVELHGGTIELESKKGDGTIFTITLPNA